MSFLAIILALLLDRLLLENESYRQHYWFDSYSSKIRGYLPDEPWSPLLPMIPLLLVAGWLQSMFDHGLPALIIGCLMLLVTLGPKDLDREANEIIDQLESGKCNQQEAVQRLDGHSAAGESADAPSVARSVLSQANPRLFSILFWFVVLGPLGAALYRLTQMTRTTLTDETQAEEKLEILDRLLYLLEWIPARLTAITYAISGSYEDAMQGWRECRPQGDQNRSILEAAGMGALFQSEARHEDQLPPPATQAEAALGMTWRALLIWLGVLGFGFAMYWMG